MDEDTVDVADLDAHDLERYIRTTHRIPVAWNNIAHFALCGCNRQYFVFIYH